MNSYNILRDIEKLSDRVEPEICLTMFDVRDGVDRLDRALVTLLAERLKYMHAAARIKRNRQAVRDNDRIEDVILKVLRHAKALGLPGNIVEPLWRDLIERSIQYELSVWDKRNGPVP